MLFQHVAIAAVSHIDAPIRLSSVDIMARLQPTLDRLGIRGNLLEDVAGIHERRIWDGPVQPSDAATMAAQKAIAASGIQRENIGILIMLEEKTRGNLTPEEAELIKSVLYDLRMQYVAIQQALGGA